jgi:hypothetical protein
MKFDPDLWIVDIEDGRGRHFLLDDELHQERLPVGVKQA